MYKSLHFCCTWILVAVVPVGFCAKHSIDHPIWTIDLLNEPPQNTTASPPAMIQHNEYLIDVININSQVSFFTIQAHSFIEDITLSFDESLETNLYITGTNIGLIWTRAMEINQEINKTLQDDTVRLFLVRQNPVLEKVTVLLAITTYTKDDPIPGGCNFNFETMLAPYQKVAYDNDIITVTSQPPSRDAEFCNKDNISTDMYYMYLTEYNNEIEEYFFGIQKMMTVQNILKYGTKVPSGLGRSKFEQMYNLYRGTGRVFAVISTLNGRSSAYVPTVSFGCDLTHWTEECVGPIGVHWKLMCAFLLILGTFVCFGGHRFFKTGLFVMGFTFGAMVTLLLLTIDDYFSTEIKTLFSVTTGVVCGCMALLLWCKYGTPLISVQLTFLLAGTLIASIIFYNKLGDQFFLTDNLFYWLVFTVIVIITFMPIFLYPSFYHIVCLSLLGSYSFIVALNYYVGGNLPYILINTYRRIAVQDFGQAVVDPPYQFLDFSQTLLWAILFGLGVYIQYKHSIGKSPFPPHRPGVDSRPSTNETTPLIDAEVAASSGTPTALAFDERMPYHSNKTPPPPYSA